MTISTPPPAASDPAPPLSAPPARHRAATLHVLAAMAGKEARELAPWLMLITLAYSAALAFAFYQIAHERTYSLSSFLSPAFFAVSILMSPAAAMLLGFVQTEIRPDRYAFLVHRPASRPLLFWSKLLTGIPLYLICT